jgi:hypothetical protein
LKKATLDDQINSLGTSLENTKTDLQFNQRTNKSQKDEIQLLTKEVENLQLKLKQRDQNVEAARADLKSITHKLQDKDNEIAKSIASNLEKE